MFQAMCRTAYTKAMLKNIVLVAEELIGYGLK